MIVSRKRFDAEVRAAREVGLMEGSRNPPVMYAGGSAQVRRDVLRAVTLGNAVVPREVSRVEHIMGVRGGVLLCDHSTPSEIEREAFRRGVTLVHMGRVQ